MLFFSAALWLGVLGALAWGCVEVPTITAADGGAGPMGGSTMGGAGAGGDPTGGAGAGGDPTGGSPIGGAGSGGDATGGSPIGGAGAGGDATGGSPMGGAGAGGGAQGGMAAACVPTNDGVEICDGLDNDCDGTPDNPQAFAESTCCDGEAGGPPCNACPAGTLVPDGWACIPAGTFTMGSPDDEENRSNNESPQREVTISAPFLMMTTEVTQAQWAEVFDNDPSQNEGRDESCAQCPVERVNWWEAIAYANALSRAADLPECYSPQGCEGAAGVDLNCDEDLDVRFVGVGCRGYRLPTEAEWEYAARAGTETRYWSGDAEADLARVDWYRDNSSPDGNDGTRQTHPVGTKPANPWGLFDVHGNVFDWVNDWRASYDGAGQQDPVGPLSGTHRVGRGGSYWYPAGHARSAYRYADLSGYRHHYVGFRLVLRPSP
jgi:sulfatase modifying factor 1